MNVHTARAVVTACRKSFLIVMVPEMKPLACVSITEIIDAKGQEYDQQQLPFMAGLLTAPLEFTDAYATYTMGLHGSDIGYIDRFQNPTRSMCIISGRS
jgi:hypothetical protein